MKVGTLANKVSKNDIVTTINDKCKKHSNIISIKNEIPATAELNIKGATVD